jgi:hypothetical protein
MMSVIQKLSDIHKGHLEEDEIILTKRIVKKRKTVQLPNIMNRPLSRKALYNDIAYNINYFEAISNPNKRFSKSIAKFPCENQEHSSLPIIKIAKQNSKTTKKLSNLSLFSETTLNSNLQLNDLNKNILSGNGFSYSSITNAVDIKNSYENNSKQLNDIYYLKELENLAIKNNPGVIINKDGIVYTKSLKPIYDKDYLPNHTKQIKINKDMKNRDKHVKNSSCEFKSSLSKNIYLIK